MTRDGHLFGPGPKRVLALDGGGTLGVIELAFLARIETLLRERCGGGPNFRLCDWFDLIGGTSTGAIIAAGLATGLSVAEITQVYLELAPLAFRRRRWRLPGLVPRYDARPLARLLRARFGDSTMDSPDIRTGLLIMARRFDTGSPWLLSNNPRAPYWADPPDKAFHGNRHYRLAEVIRASTAAPGLFRPQTLQVVPNAQPGVFIDGGLSPYNNPSLALLMLTQARAFGLCWPLGDAQLMLVSIGTGQHRRGLRHGAQPPHTAGMLAWHALLDTVADAQLLTLALLQWFSEPAMSWPINSEIGDFSGELLGGRALLRFQRYDMPLEAGWLNDALGLQLTPEAVLQLRRFDEPAHMAELHRMAARVAELQVLGAHFPAAFDPGGVEAGRTRAPD